MGPADQKYMTLAATSLAHKGRYSVARSVIAHPTELPSNLRPTTRECVHLVTRGHFRSRDKVGGHTIRSAVSVNSMLHANFMALCVTETQLLPIEVTLREYGFWTFSAPVTLTLTR